MGTLQRRVEANEADSARLCEDDDSELELAVMSGGAVGRDTHWDVEDAG